MVRDDRARMQSVSNNDRSDRGTNLVKHMRIFQGDSLTISHASVTGRMDGERGLRGTRFHYNPFDRRWNLGILINPDRRF